MASHVAACAERRVFTAECRLRRHDGEYRWVYCSRVPRHSSDGTFLGYIGTCIDITERKAAEEQLEKEHAFLRQVIDINPNFIFAKDRMGRFTMANKAVADAYGTTVDKLIGKTDAEFDDNTHEVQHFRQVDLEVMNTLQERFIAEEKITDADGNIRWLQTVKRPIVEKDGSVNQILGASTDITRRKAAESDARRNRADLAHVARVSVMGELAGSLAHELNQPLTAILSNTQAALRFMNAKPMDVVEVRETLEDVVHESKRASQVISHMRALVKKGPLEVAPIELGIIMREVGELMRSDAIMRGVQLEFDIQPNLPMVLGDRVQLEQVMLNLLLNAFDAMAGVPHHQRLAVVQVTREGDAAVKIAVHDQGVGLSTEMRERIFKPFFTTKKDGLGLGLSICRSIIEAHGGYLRADSSRDDGTTFYFTFPVVGAVQSTLQGEAA
jgi:PAS domain S-box-containing protein